MFNQKKTISELEQSDWGPAPSDASPLVKVLAKLRHKPVKNFTVEDIRVMIGQDIGLQYLMPMAVSILDKNPFAEGMHYKGDLLCNVLRISPDFYKEHAEVKEKVREILARAKETMGSLGKIDAECLAEALEEAISEFDR